ncbi:hypothetical protein QVD17_28271 [Tagetes erecta]|uniref:C2 NT-type domain-containing protein n=1 Tax=Tagetes erecta TaxID=13708 RepID=A0AAD8KAP2_TARER|nr:hypothetical protein QVD17_28271 [Tagetes erecta]
MFKSPRWRINKIKCVFKLQFHGTQLGVLGGEDLMIYVVPADVGKPTSRSEKAKFQDGSCYWEKPLYETVKFLQDPKTGKFHEKIYYFVVAKDSSRFGGVGEVSIDLASYVEATEISSLALPFKNANSFALLHVSIQKMHGSSDPRDINGSYNGIYTDHQASIGSDIMLSSSDISSWLDTPHKHEPKSPKLTREFSITKDRFLQWDWLNVSAPKLSKGASSTSTLEEIYEENCSYTMIQDLKVKVAALTRQAEVSELELETLRKQIMNEMKKGRDISREVATLKEERNALKEKCEKLKSEEVNVKINGMLLIDQTDPWSLVGELRRELVHEKDLCSNLRLQLQETQKSNAELVLALEISKSKSESICFESEMDYDEEQRELEEFVQEHSDVKETYLLEQKIVRLYGEIDFYKKDKDDLELQMEQMALDYEILKQENHDISCKLKHSQLQEQCTPYTTVDELETQIESLENDLKSKSNELSKSKRFIKDLESHIKNLEQELENQGHEFDSSLEELMLANTNQEQRAVRAENNLRKMILHNANAATRLQEELKRLSQNMASILEVKDKEAMKAIDEANKLRVEKRVLEDTLMKVKKDLQDLDSSENLFLHKEKDLQLEIEKLETKLDMLVQKTKKSQRLCHFTRDKKTQVHHM